MAKKDKETKAVETTETTDTTDTTIYRVPKDGGMIDFVSKDEAVKDIVSFEVFNAEDAATELDKGSSLSSPTHYYSADFEKLKEYEVLEGEVTDAPGDAPTDDKPLAEGDTVVNTETQLTGTVYVKGGILKVEYKKDGKKATCNLDEKWVRYEPGQTDLVVNENPETEIEVISPLTDEERAEFLQLESEIQKAKDELEEVVKTRPLLIGKHLNRIREGKLYREVAATFADYAQEKFGFARQYAQQLARAADFQEIAKESLQLSEGSDLSVKTATALAKHTDDISEELGLGRAEYNAVRPIIENTMTALVQAAPKDAQGKAIITPLVVTKFNEVISDIVKQGVIEIDGKQYTLEEAKAQGLLNVGMQSQVVMSAAEVILAQKDQIAENYTKATERQQSPVLNGGTSHAKELYKGKKVDFSGKCSKHGAQDIISIGNGTIQIECLCRFRMDKDSGVLVCYEVDGKKVA